MAENNKKPKLRFERFTDDWKLRKIGEVLTEKRRPIEMEDDKEYQLVTVKRRNEGVVPRGLFRGKAILVKNYFEIKAGDYIISKRQVVHGANGIVPETLDKAIVSNEYLVVVGNENITTDFWMIISKLRDMYKKFFLSSYGVDIEKLVFDVEDWKKRTVDIPSLAEQKRICEFFKQLDYLISLHQLRYDKTVNIKKAMLEKMFPKDGEDHPKIRFYGFTEAWESRKLKDFGKATGGTSIEDQFVENGRYKVISIGSYSEQSIYTDQGIRADKTKKTANRILNKDDLTMILNDKTASGNIIGRVLLIDSDDSYVYNQRTERIEPYYEEYDSQFLYQLLNAPMIRSKIMKQAQGNTQIYVNWSTIEELDYLVPKLDEQKKMGSFFKQFDHLIIFHQRELEKLQNIKKACFKKMFV